MKLVIGGYAQGKLNYVRCNYDVDTTKIWDGEIPEKIEEQTGTVVINHLHCLVKQKIMQGGCPEDEIFSFVERYQNGILISDEVGNGIVPIEPLEREYRERMGRILVELAKRAEKVERVICGIGQKIK